LLLSVDMLCTLEGKTVSGGRINLHKALLTVSNQPVLSVNTASISNKLNINETDTITFKLKNIGGGQSNYSITIDPQSSWLTHEPEFGTVSGGESDFIQLYFDTDGMSYGNYQVEMIIQDENSNEIILPVHLNVTQFVVGMDDIAVKNNLKTWPNPFINDILIDFSVAENTNINLGIYDSYGRIVKTLIVGSLYTGTHNIKWDGTSTNGNKVPPGIYYCLLKTDSSRLVKKILRLEN